VLRARGFIQRIRSRTLAISNRARPKPNTRQREAEMGFLFYANFVRIVLEGGFTHILVERAREWVKAAGRVPTRD
jgi:hypothetical protein